MDKRVTSQWRAAAFHEAGHAVVARFLGVRFISVSIDRVSRAGFLLTIYEELAYVHSSGLSPAISHEHHTKALVDLAGLASERRHDGRFHWRNATDDLIDATRRAAALHPGGNSTEVGAFLQYSWIRTIEIVKLPLVWESINQVADALMERRSLTEREAINLMIPATRLRDDTPPKPIDQLTELGRHILLDTHQDRTFLRTLAQRSIEKTRISGWRVG